MAQPSEPDAWFDKTCTDESNNAEAPMFVDRLKRDPTWWVAGAAVVLWLLSALGDSFTLRSVLLLVLLLATAALYRPLGEVQSPGGWTFKWGIQDYIGLAILLVVGVALLAGVRPQDLLNILIKTKS